MRSIRQYSLSYVLAALTVSLLILVSVGCGGGGSSTTTGQGVATTLQVGPASLSLNPGQVVQLNAVLLDGTGAQITNTTYSYAATGGVQVSTLGLVCAGTWDSLTTPVVCTPPANPVGTGTVTVTSSGITTTVNAAIHPRIARVTISTTAPAICNSQTETQQYTARAFDANGVDITAQAGAFTYTSSNTASVTVDANGLATAVQPGGAFITASSNGVFSVPSGFNSCQPLSIVLAPGAAASLAIGSTLQLTPTVTDIKGNPITITGLALSYISSRPTVASVGTAGLITAAGAGSAGIIASCSPPTCNGGANANIPVYSNLVPINVAGTSATTAYVTGATATSIIPIDTTTNVAGTAITIQQINSAQPIINSFVFGRDGTSAYLGSDRSLLILAASTGALTTPTTQLSGKVLAVSPNGAEVIYADQSGAPKTYVFNTASGTFIQLSLTTVTTAASYSADSLKAYLVSGGSLWAYSAALSPPLLRQITPASGANDATFLSQGPLGYVAGGTANSVVAYATCNNSVVSTIAVPATPLKIDSSFDSTHVFAVDGTSVDDIAVSNISTVAGQNCPATVSNSLTTVNFGQGTFTPNQLIVTADGSNVFVTTPTNKLLRYTVAGNATSAITLATGTAITTGGATLDGQNLYLGVTGTNDVHRISVSSGTDAQQIAVSLKDANSAAVSPDFVVVRPK